MLNRELSLIQFYRRVLAKTVNEDIPLLERLGYLCIVSKNCDELFEVRVARLLKWNKESPGKILPEGVTANHTLIKVHNAATALYDRIYRIYHQILIPKLNEYNIFILDNKIWSKAQQKWAHNYFRKELKPALSPIDMEMDHPPSHSVPNKGLHFLVDLKEGKQKSEIAIVEAPINAPRVLKLPPELAPENSHCFILLQDIIQLYIHEVFPKLKVQGCYPFRVTRAADLILKTNETNLRFAVTQQINNRRFAECSRLELDISSNLPRSDVIEFLVHHFNISLQDLYLAKGPVNLSRLLELVKMVDMPQLKYPIFIPGLPKELIKEPNIFKAMSKSDILIHTPYQSFDPILKLTKEAANDPSVVAIKMTVYRTGQDSEVVQNLILAAKAGKKVVASIELFARFDEEANVELANQLEKAGALVVYGVMGYKVHAKMLLITRKENGKLKQYAHLGTGNYHQKTATLYTDFGLLTTNPDVTHDIDNIFAQITGTGHADVLKIIYQSPFTLHDLIIKQIEQETYNAQTGKTAKIIAKMNSLLETQVIHSLYKASQAGVKITLIVRGACALRPNVAGLSENIQVKSIVGRFLEHTRIFYFYNLGQEDLFLSSADWMKRNFFRRIETCVPILDKKVKKRIINEGLKLYMHDNIDAWVMSEDGSYTPIKPRIRKVSAQKSLMKKLGTIIDNK